MRRQFVLLLVLLIGTVALASAQEEQPGSDEDRVGIPLAVAPQHMISGEVLDLVLEPVPPPLFPDTPDAGPASDFCTDQTTLLTLDPSDGGQTITNNMSVSPDDPHLSCMWGSPGSAQGYRTVWYRFIPDKSGWVVIGTTGSTYDTVLSIYSGSCGALTQLSCNDDNNGFASQVSVPVFSGQTYYVEVADWHQGVSGSATLALSAELIVATSWELLQPFISPTRSRHASEVFGEDIYIIAGQAVAGQNPVRVPFTQRYNTRNNQWTSLASMPGGDDGLGYSNTTSALVNGKIYLPSGFVGDISIYDDTHWSFDINANTWSVEPSNQWWVGNGGPSVYASAVEYSSGSTNGYFLAGGLTGPLPPKPPLVSTEWEARDELYFYQLSGLSGFWTQKTSMLTGRYGHIAALQNIGGQDYVCVAGGIGKDDTDDTPFVIPWGECYNIGTNTWNISIGNMNYPRYNAASAVDSNGNWYVYGGTDANGNSVFVTERFDAASQSWIPLDARYDLGTTPRFDLARPARAWPRGGFVGQTLWAIGGHQNISTGDIALNLVERIVFPDEKIFAPLVTNSNDAGEPNNTFSRAKQLHLNQPRFEKFFSADDWIDMYFFDVPSARTITLELNQIPSGSDYNLALYTDNKLLKGISANPGSNPEIVNVTLGTGRYYVMVTRVFPPPGIIPSNQAYRIIAHG